MLPPYTRVCSEQLLHHANVKQRHSLQLTTGGEVGFKLRFGHPVGQTADHLGMSF